ncbi:FliH/SctL family protein [Candidatus Margulisiibacteriota bacterium]
MTIIKQPGDIKEEVRLEKIKDLEGAILRKGQGKAKLIISKHVLKSSDLISSRDLQIAKLKDFKPPKPKKREVEPGEKAVDYGFADTGEDQVQPKPEYEQAQPFAAEKEEFERDLERQKQDILAQTEEEAKQSAKQSADTEMNAYKEQKMKDIDSEKKATLDKAHKEGYEKGKEIGLSELRQQGQELIDAVNSLAKEKERIIKEQEPELLSLSIKIAERIVQTKIEQDPEVINKVVDDAIRRITDKDRVIIRVNAKDAEVVRKHRDYLHKLMSDIKNLEVEEDKRVERGGCIIETKLGFIDSSTCTKLETIEKAIFASYNAEEEAGEKK